MNTPTRTKQVLHVLIAALFAAILLVPATALAAGNGGGQGVGGGQGNGGGGTPGGGKGRS